jgi:hypothetical protein
VGCCGSKGEFPQTGLDMVEGNLLGSFLSGQNPECDASSRVGSSLLRPLWERRASRALLGTERRHRWIGSWSSDTRNVKLLASETWAQMVFLSIFEDNFYRLLAFSMLVIFGNLWGRPWYSMVQCSAWMHWRQPWRLVKPKIAVLQVLSHSQIRVITHSLHIT